MKPIFLTFLLVALCSQNIIAQTYSSDVVVDSVGIESFSVTEILTDSTGGNFQFTIRGVVQHELDQHMQIDFLTSDSLYNLIERISFPLVLGASSTAADNNFEYNEVNGIYTIHFNSLENFNFNLMLRLVKLDETKGEILIKQITLLQ